MDKSLTKQVLDNSAWNFLKQIMQKLMALVFTILLIRFLLPEKFGIYSLTLAIAMIFMSLGDLGIDRTFIVFFSKHIDKNKEKSKAYFNFLFKIKFLLIFSISLILLAGSYIFSKYIFKSPDLLRLLPIAAAYIFIFSLTGFFSSFFYIYRKVKLDFIKETLFQTVRLMLILILFIFFPFNHYLIGIFIALLIASLIIFFFTFYYSKKLAPFLFTKTKAIINKKEVLIFLIFLIASSISFIVFSEIDIFMLGLLIKNFIFIGYYRACFILVLGASALVSIAPVLLPVFSSLQKIRLKRAFDKIIRLVFIFNIPAVFGVLLFGRYVIKLAYGSEYLPGSFLLYFFAFLIFSETTTQLLTTLFSARERPKIIAKSILIALILNIILNYILITTLLKISLVWATSGAAIATLLSRYFFMSTLIFYSKKEFGIKIRPDYIIKPLISSLIMTLILYVITSQIDINLFSGILLILFSMLFYFLMMFLFKGIKQKDLKLIKLLLKR